MAHFQTVPAVETGLRLTLPTGDAIPCQRHNKGWYNFVLPAETAYICLDMSAPDLSGFTLVELTLFVGAQEWSLPIPSARRGDATRNVEINLPAMPYWVQGLLCIRLEQAEQAA
ncbi:hypothetical protein NQF87_02520 [Bombella sp. TMW 2.2559]|uniref:Uncharacterized protein n=1 Tax=Bombella dulcis TaxID=2967339 RepID=A0ABT3WDI9_9PROT|nr:hypothetical protein [Bombella dulcis]MCX5615857.1 hypothetical protein [Bombella dulcis]